MTDPVEELMHLMELSERERVTHRLKYYEPYPKQMDFHNAIGKGTSLPAAQRLMLGANQCISPWTYVETESESALSSKVFALEGGNVVSLVGESECVSRSMNGILKGIEPAFRLVMEHGDYFDCSANHQVMTEHGWMHIDQLMSLSNGLRCTQRVEDYQASCVADGYLCDPRLLSEEGSDLRQLLGQVDALNNTLSFSHKDAEERVQQHTNVSLLSSPLTISDDGRIRHAGLYAQFAAPFSSRPFLLLTSRILECLQSPAGLSLQRSFLEFCLSDTSLNNNHEEEQNEFHVFQSMLVGLLLEYQVPQKSAYSFSQGCSLTQLHHGEDHISIFYPFEHPKLIGGNKIIAVVPIGWQPIIDVQVPGPNNYKSAGVYHHNSGKTMCGAMESAMHLTGQYPDWWKGTRYKYPITMMVGSNTNETCRDIIQKELFGEPLDDTLLGTGTIPIECIGTTTRKAGVVNAYDAVQIKHVSGGVSTIYLRAYEQGFKKFMGIRFTVGWLDEEPPQEIWSQFLRAGLAQKSSILYITMTPEEGMTKVVTQFMNDLQVGQSLSSITWEDAKHFTPEIIKAKLAAFSPHEREMRSKGVPLMGAGLIFQQTDESMAVDPFPIPRHWPQIVGIDFGWDHPFAGVKVAWDRDSDCIYVTNDYRESRAIPAVHSQAIKAWGEWVPVAWPHDGLNTEKGTGEQLRDKYSETGLNMLPWKATNPPQAGQKEGEGGNSVEASLLDMNDRMETGRFKVFSTCKTWFEEKKMYHRDKNGKIVKQNDDCISGSRYACMMIRHARVMSVKPRRTQVSQGASNWT